MGEQDAADQQGAFCCPREAPSPRPGRGPLSRGGVLRRLSGCVGNVESKIPLPLGVPTAYSNFPRTNGPERPAGAADLENRILRSKDRRRQTSEIRISGESQIDVNFSESEISGILGRDLTNLLTVAGSCRSL